MPEIKEIKESDFVKPETDGQLVPFTNPDLDPFARNVLNQNVYLIVNNSIPDVSAADAGKYGNFFVSDSSWRVISITEVHRVVASAGSVQVEKIPSGNAKNAAGNFNLLATAFDLTASVDTPRFGTLTNTKADLILRRGDRLGSKITGLTGAPEDVLLTIILQKI